ncbi:unnamed protein product [marine sediment metagenome]|uniref:Phospholipid/glycerol acyltransferase domain-containing protein n=1 Tax=marine sediment metagenome TaxID=412755 RepID=X1GXL5_9ZZZZ
MKENLVNIKKPAIFVANHNSHLDTPIILKALPFYLRKKIAVAAAADYFFEGKFWLPIFVRIFLNAYPFSRTSAKDMAFKDLLRGILLVVIAIPLFAFHWRKAQGMWRMSLETKDTD